MKLTAEEQKEFYNEITKFYDLAEKIIDAIEEEGIKNPELQVKLVGSIIDQVEESTDVLAESYIAFVENEQEATPSDVRRVESAIRKIFSSILKFTNELNRLPNEAV